MVYLFTGMIIGGIIGLTVGSLAAAFKAAEKELGSIPAMLRATKPVLSERQYKELCNEVNKANGYLEQKRIIFSYVDPIIKG